MPQWVRRGVKGSLHTAHRRRTRVPLLEYSAETRKAKPGWSLRPDWQETGLGGEGLCPDIR